MGLVKGGDKVFSNVFGLGMFMVVGVFDCDIWVFLVVMLFVWLDSLLLMVLFVLVI